MLQLRSSAAQERLLIVQGGCGRARGMTSHKVARISSCAAEIWRSKEKRSLSGSRSRRVKVSVVSPSCAGWTGSGIAVSQDGRQLSWRCLNRSCSSRESGNCATAANVRIIRRVFASDSRGRE